MERIATPSATNPWLVKMEPGIYDLGDEALVMRPFVDIEGSGQGVTTVTSAGVNTVIAASDAEIRELTIRNTSPHSPAPPEDCPLLSRDCYAVLVDTGVDAKITNAAIHTTNGTYPLRVKDGATVEVDGGSITCAISCQGVQVDLGAAATLGDTTIRALDTGSLGIQASGTVNVTNSTIDVEFIALQVGGTANVYHSILRAASVAVFFPGEVNIGASQIVLSDALFNGTCVASYDGDFNLLGPNCAPL